MIVDDLEAWNQPEANAYNCCRTNNSVHHLCHTIVPRAFIRLEPDVGPLNEPI